MKDDYIEVNRHAYNRLADHYRQRRSQKSTYEANPMDLANILLQNYQFNLDSAQYLEVGPGGGDVLSIIEKSVGSSTAVDLSPEIIRLCEEVTTRTSFISANILDLDFPQNSFDLIYLGAVIHLFPEEDAKILIQRLQKWLSDKGLLFINTTIAQKSEEGYHEKKDSSGNIIRFRRSWTEKDFMMLIDNGNLRVINKYFTNEKDRSKVWIGLLCSKMKNIEFKDFIEFQGRTSTIINRDVAIEGEVIRYEVSRRPAIVLVVPILENGETLTVYQYRSAVNKFVVEFPAGKIETNESAKEAAARELEEETGYKCRDLKEVYEFYTAPHFTDEIVKVFIARGLYKGNKSPEKEEFIYLRHSNWTDLFEDKEICDSKTMTALFIMKKLLGNEKYHL